MDLSWEDIELFVPSTSQRRGWREFTILLILRFFFFTFNRFSPTGVASPKFMWGPRVFSAKKGVDGPSFSKKWFDGPSFSEAQSPLFLGFWTEKWLFKWILSGFEAFWGVFWPFSSLWAPFGWVLGGFEDKIEHLVPEAKIWGWWSEFLGGGGTYFYKDFHGKYIAWQWNVMAGSFASRDIR